MKKDKVPGFVVIAALTTLTAVLWVSVAVYFKLKTEEPPKVPEEITKQINPTLDQETLTSLMQKFYVDESEIPDTIITETQETIRPTQTPRATISSSPTASPSGNQTTTPTPNSEL